MATSIGVAGGCTSADEAATVWSSPQNGSPVVSTSSAHRVTRYVVLEGPSAIASAGDLDAESPAGRKRIAARAAELRAQHDALRPVLEAQGATVIADVVLVANVLQVVASGEALERIAALPGVAGLEVPTQIWRARSESVPLIGAPEAWTASNLHGEGIRIGIVDTGIDYYHADFGGAGDPNAYAGDDPTIVEAGSFPTAVVIGGLDLAGNGYDSSGLKGDVIPVPDDDPLDCDGHGTHVAGIAAGRGVLLTGSAYEGSYDASLDPSAFTVTPGVAPLASLYAIKVFGCEGSTDLLLPALEFAVDPDGDLDPGDRLDVVNASLGSAFDDATEVEAAAIAALTAAGSLLVASQGNRGGLARAHFSAGFPASAPEALAVGATLKTGDSTDYLALSVTAPSSVAAIYPVGVADFGPTIEQLGTFGGEVAVAEPVLACDPLTNGAALAGKIALVRRGTCTFALKTQHAAAAGAIGVLIVDNAFDDFPVEPGGSGNVGIPTFGLRRADGEKLIAAVPLSLSLTAGEIATVTVGPDWVARFSARGPTARSLLQKPDVSAPGVAVVSAAVGTGTAALPLDGTSMAAPMVSGAAALLRQGRPDLGPLAIKQLVTSSARPVVNGLEELFPSTLAGSGRVQIDDALATEITAAVDGVAGEVGVSFGALVVSSNHTEERTVVVTNHGAAAADLAIAVVPSMDWPGIAVNVSPATVIVPAGGSATFTLSLAVAPSELPPSPAYESFTVPVGGNTDLFSDTEVLPSILPIEATGVVTLTPVGGGLPSVVAYHGMVRAAAERHVSEVTGCRAGAGASMATLHIEGTPGAKTHATSVLVLGAEDAEDADIPAAYDIVAVGALADAVGERLFFGVVTAGPWSTPAQGWHSVVGVEIDRDGDRAADHLVLAEAFYQLELLSIVPLATPFSRTFELETGAIATGFQPLNGAIPAYPGGTFFDSPYPDSHETQIYHNNVIVFAVDRDFLGLGDGAIAYRAVSGVSRAFTVTGKAPALPRDTSAWVDLDLDDPPIALQATIHGSPLYPDDAGALQLAVHDEAQPLLVLHHTNGASPHHEIVALDALEGSDLAVVAEALGAAGSAERSVALTVSNTGSARRGVTLALEATGAAIVSASASAGSCTSESCALGELGAGETATVTVALSLSGGEASLTATVTSASACEAAPDNDVAIVTLEPATALPPPPVEDGGCGCRLIPARGTPGWWLGASVLLLGLGRRRSPARGRANHRG